MSEPIDTERIRSMIVGRMGFVPQEFADEIRGLVAQAWDEGFESGYRYEYEIIADKNPYRTET